MAAAQPAINNNNGTIVDAVTPPAKPTTLAASLGNRTGTPPKSQRGLNKPKCKQCGNVARSRCPFESCKSCCSRNQNPCHIHVLKANPTAPDKSPSSSAAPLEQQSSKPSPSSNAGRVTSLRHLSNNFGKFSNLHVSLGSRKPITRKDAAIINKWRFSKVRECTESNIEVENDAFDRYMQNVALLEEVLSVESPEDDASSSLVSDPTSMGNNEMMIPWMKLLERSNSMRSDSVRNRISQIVDEGLRKLQKSAVRGDAEASERQKILRTERLLDISELIDKINKARSEEDLKACLDMKSQLFNLDQGSSKPEVVDKETHKKLVVEGDLAAVEVLDYSFPKLVVAREIDQETLNTIHTHFCSLEHVEQL